MSPPMSWCTKRYACQFVASRLTSADHVGSGLRDTPVGGGPDLEGGGRGG
jgi:hypothetical protein